MFCWSLFVPLYFFFWPLCCLLFLDIYRFWLPLWYWIYTDSDYPSGIGYIQILITPLVLDTYRFWLPLWYWIHTDSDYPSGIFKLFLLVLIVLFINVLVTPWLSDFNVKITTMSKCLESFTLDVSIGARTLVSCVGCLWLEVNDINWCKCGFKTIGKTRIMYHDFYY